VVQDRLSRARMAWIREIFDDGIPDAGPGALDLVRVADQTRQAGDPDLAMNLLVGAALRCFWGRPPETTRNAVISAARKMSVADGDPRLVVSLAVHRGGQAGGRVPDAGARQRH
jgi:hypothetical protein